MNKIMRNSEYMVAVGEKRSKFTRVGYGEVSCCGFHSCCPSGVSAVLFSVTEKQQNKHYECIFTRIYWMFKQQLNKVG